MQLLQAFRTLTIIAAFVVTITGCQPYKDYLFSLPVTERTHNGEAVAIVSEVYGIDYRTPVVRWVVQDSPIADEGGGYALGVTHDCDTWVWWAPAYGPDPKDSRVFGHTVLSHEMAHCALWLYRGDADPDHSDVEWWGTRNEQALGGLVGVAMNALTAQGM